MKLTKRLGVVDGADALGSYRMRAFDFNFLRIELLQ